MTDPVLSDAQYAPLGGREGLCYAMSLLPWSVALGTGDPAWDAVARTDALWQAGLLPDAADSRGLVAEVGRRIADRIEFVVPDPAGGIRMPDGSRWSVSAAVSNSLYIEATFDFEDGLGMTVREIGLCAGHAVAAGVPPGQRWLAPAELAAPGHLMQLMRLAYPYVRAPARLPLFRFVHTF
jgi:hypothetical protein